MLKIDFGLKNRMTAWAGCVALLLLSSCGGGGDGAGGQPSTDTQACTADVQRQWLSSQFREQYLWASITPAVDPLVDLPVESFFRDSLFRGNESIPSDRFSYFQSAQTQAQYFDEGMTMGYGLAVAGQEVLGRPDQPLWIRDVNPASPAASARLARGDRVVSLNGVSSESVIERSDFSALVAQTEGQSLDIVVERGGKKIEARLVARIHGVMPVRHGDTYTLPDGRKVGLIRIHAMIQAADQDLLTLFRRFRTQSVDAVILDLRYNGGGAVSVGRRVASLAAGQTYDGRVYARLVHNAQQSAALDQTFSFFDEVGWRGVSRVYVLAGSRTCSASEQVIAGLRGIGVEVVVIGGTTCGKPVGFRPRDHCGQTWSLVNFESRNALGQGGYYRGLEPQCPVAEDFTLSLDDPREPLVATALRHAQGFGCSVSAGGDRSPLYAAPSPRARMLRDGADVLPVMRP